MAQSYYTPRTIQSGQVPSSQSNFPALVLLNDTRYKTTGYTGGHVANTNGYDIRFYSDAALTTALTFELVTYNASAGTGEFWVLLPTCDVAVTIYIGYGDASLNTNASSTSTWASQYKLRMHLPDGTTLTALDSTSNANNGTLTNTPTATSGQIDGAGNFVAASTQYISTGTTGFPSGSAAISVFAWVYLTSTPSVAAVIFNYGPSSFGANNTSIILSANTSGGVVYAAFSGYGNDYRSTLAISLNAWHRVGFTYAAGGNLGSVKIYVDGASQTGSGGSVLAVTASPARSWIARFIDTGNVLNWNGKLDEIGLTNNTLAPDWITAEYNNQSNNPAFWPDGTEVQVAGPQFDAASNSGDQASANYTFNRTVSGTNRFLIVSVELLTVTGATVTSVTDDDGGGNVALSFIGAKSTITGAGRVEMWGLTAPATGTKAIRVILSASIESVATAISYTNVHQVTPTEAFNSAQATNAGSATNASVTVTSVTDNCRIVAACVANDTSITAGQTSRNNVSGTLGSGADEDNNAAVSPAGATTMTYTGMGITTTWAIVGVAVRPYAAPTGNLFRLSSLSGVGAGGPFFQNPVN